LFGQSSRSWNTLSPITAARSVTSLPGRRAGLTLLPLEAPSPFLRTMTSLRSRSEKMPLANLCNRHDVKNRHPLSRPILESRVHTRLTVASCAPRELRTLVRFPKCCISRRRRLTITVWFYPGAEGYPDLESRSGWCRYRELCPDPDVPTWDKPIRVDRALMARSKPAPAYSAKTRARQNRPLTLPVTPPGSRPNESADPATPRCQFPYLAAQSPPPTTRELPRVPRLFSTGSAPPSPASTSRSAFRRRVSPH